MRILVDVKTVGRSVIEIREDAIAVVDAAIKKLTQRCVVCQAKFLPERRKRKKYCGDQCRWMKGNETALDRYHKRQQEKKKA